MLSLHKKDEGHLGEKTAFEIPLAIKEWPISFNEKYFCTVYQFLRIS